MIGSSWWGILSFDWLPSLQDYSIMLACRSMTNLLNPVEMKFSGLAAFREYERYELAKEGVLL
jgi:hypothetical protein